MNSFEWFLLLTLAASLVVGPLIGYRAGKIVGKKASRRNAFNTGYAKGYDAGGRDADGDVAEAFAPLPARNVRLSE